MSSVIELSDSDDDQPAATRRRVATNDDDDNDDIVILPTRPAAGVTAPKTEPRVPIVVVDDDVPLQTPAEPRPDYTIAPLVEPVRDRQPVVIVEPSVVSTAAPTALSLSSVDTRTAANAMYATRRLALMCNRLGLLLSNTGFDTPTERTAMRPVAPINDADNQTLLYESVAANDAYLALEYGSAYAWDVEQTYEQGDKFDYSDTPSFSIGRAVEPNDDDEDDEGVPPKRVADVDAPDIDPQSREAARYQHSFRWSAARFDATLPISAMMPDLIATHPARDKYYDTLRAFASRDNALHRVTLNTLKQIGNGVPRLMSNLSFSTVATAVDYNAVRNKASHTAVARRIAMSVEEARASIANASATATPERRTFVPIESTATEEPVEGRQLPLQTLESLAKLEEDLVERAPNAALPNLLRARATSGPFTVFGALLEYDLANIAESVVRENNRAFGVKQEPGLIVEWSEVASALKKRERAGWQQLSDIDLVWRDRLTSAANRLGVSIPRSKRGDDAGPLTARGARERHRQTHPDVEEAPVQQPRKLRKRSEQTIKTSVKQKDKRKRTNEDDDNEADDDGDASGGDDESSTGMEKAGDDLLTTLSREAREPKGGIDTEVDVEDVAAVEAELKEEGYTTAGLVVKKNTDLREIGYLDLGTYRYPFVSVPIGWTAVESLKQLEALVQQQGPQAWQTEQAWRLIVELAVYAKLVPRLRDEPLFPFEARVKLVHSIALLSERLTNEQVYHSESVKYYGENAPISIAKLESAIAAIQDELSELRQAPQPAMQVDDDEDVDDKPIVKEREAQIVSAQQRLDAAKRQLELEQRDDYVPDSLLPAVVALHVGTEQQFAVLEQMQGQQVGTLFDDTQRVALALAYATAGRTPKDARTLLETRLLQPAVGETPDARYYPITTYVATGELARLFSDRADRSGIDAVQEFANQLGVLEQVQAEETQLGEGAAGAYLERLYAQQQRLRGETASAALAQTIYPLLAKRGTVNNVKRVYLPPPAVATDVSIADASSFVHVIFSSAGVFDLRELAVSHRQAATDIDNAERAANEERGAERLVASAAQRDVNERFPASRFTIGDVALVAPDFDISDELASVPVGVFAVAGNEIVVDREPTIELLSSDQLLGGGKIVASNVPLYAAQDPAVVAARSEQLAAAQSIVDTGTVELATLDEESIEAVSLRDRIAAAEQTIATLAADDTRKPFVADVKGGAAPFTLFLPPDVLAKVCRRVATGLAAQACSQYVGWYDRNGYNMFTALAVDWNDFNTYRRIVQRLNSELETLTPQIVELPTVATLDQFVDNVVTALSASRVIHVREESTRPDSTVVQPFSCLAALERATTQSRMTMRDSFKDIWYQLAAARRWSRFGYMRTPFNSSAAFALPRADVRDSAYDNWQLIHLALRQALRQHRRNNDAGADEGDSDNDAPADDKSTMQLDFERREGLLELQTLCNQLENEVAHSMTASTLWFDLFEVGSRPFQFAALVRRAIVDMYTALVSQRRVATTSLLSTRHHASPDLPPFAVEAQAQSVIDRYWQNLAPSNNASGDGAKFGALNVIVQTFASDYDNSDTTKGFADVVDDAFYVAAVARSTAPVTSSATATSSKSALKRIAERNAFDERIRAEVQRASAQRTNNGKAGRQQNTTAYYVQQLQVKDGEYEELEDRIASLTTQIESMLASAASGEVLTNAQNNLNELRAKRKELLSKLLEAENAVRQSYASDVDRRARIKQLLDKVIADTKTVRLGNYSAYEKDEVFADLKNARTELRAAIYADERAYYEQLLTDRIEAPPADSGRTLEPDAPVPLKTQLEKLAEKRERAAIVSALEQELKTLDPLNDPAAAERVRQVRLLQPVVGSATATAAIEPALRDEAQRLLKQWQSNVRKRLTRPLPPEQKIINEHLRAIADLEKIRTNLMRPSDIREQQRLEQKTAEELALEEEVKAERSAASDKLREAVDVALYRGSLTSIEDKRHDLPTTRPKMYRQAGGDNDDSQVAYGGYYDAPMGAHKQVTIDGVSIATDILRSVNVPDSVVGGITSVVTSTQIDAYVDAALAIIDETFEPPEATDEPLRLIAADTTFRDALISHMNRVIDDAINDRVRLRFKLHKANAKDSLLTGVEENALRADIRRAVRTELAAGKTKYVLGGKSLSQLDVAALRLLQENYRLQRRSRDAAALRDSLGSIRLQRSETDLSDTVDVPAVIVFLLTPAAIERAKSLMQMTMERAAPQVNWAVANRQDAPQSWRISELVEYYARTGRLPLPSETSTAPTSPFRQYDEIRKFNDLLEPLRALQRSLTNALRKAQKEQAAKPSEDDDDEEEAAEETPSDDKPKIDIAELERDIVDNDRAIDDALRKTLPTLAAVGRVRFFPDRIAAMRGFGVVQQRASFGNGAHYAQPFAVDLAASALVAQLMRLYGSIQTSFDPTGLVLSMDVVWFDTQTDKTAAALTARIAAIPQARARLWCHLVMLYSKRGAQSDDEFIAGERHALSLPVWREMRAVDIRLLTLAVLGYDYSPQSHDTPFTPSWPYTRGHSTKYELASAYLRQTVDAMFAALPTDLASLRGVAPADSERLLAVVRNQAGQIRTKWQFNRRNTPKPSGNSGVDVVVAQFTASEAQDVVKRNIIERWTRRGAIDVDLRTISIVAEMGAKINSIVNGPTSVAVKTAIGTAAIFSVDPTAVITDVPWLLVPNCVLVGVLTRLSTSANDSSVFPSIASARVTAKRRLMEALEKAVLLNNDSAHLLVDDIAAPAGRRVVALDKSPLIARPAAENAMQTDEPEQAVVVAPPPVTTVAVVAAAAPPETNVRTWRLRLQTALKTLFDLPYDGASLQGTRRTQPFDAVDWPFARIPTSISRLGYTHNVLYPSNDILATWAIARTAIVRAKLFVDSTSELESRLSSDNAAAFRERNLVLSPEQQTLGAMLVRAETERRRYWQFNADGSSKREGANDTPLYAVSASTAVAPYQNWHVLLLAALAVEMTPAASLAAVRAYVDTQVQQTTPVLVYARRLLAAEKPAVTALEMEQIIPICDLLLYYFDDVKAATKSAAARTTLYTTSQRYPLWPLLCAPIVRRAAVLVQSTSHLTPRTTNWTTTVELAPNSAYLPFAAFTAAEARAEAQATSMANAERVVVVHSHLFTQLDNEPKEKDSKVYRARSLTTLARYVSPAGAPTYSVHDALDAAINRTDASVTMVGRIPTPSTEDQ